MRLRVKVASDPYFMVLHALRVQLYQLRSADIDLMRKLPEISCLSAATFGIWNLGANNRVRLWSANLIFIRLIHQRLGQK